jgi:hypothetical protein
MNSSLVVRLPKQAILSKTKVLAVLIGFALAGHTLADAPSWLDVNARLMDQALSAKKNDINPTDATAAMIAGGTQGAYTVQAITTAYGSCPALEAAVTEAVRNEPANAYDIIAGVQDLEACPCTADNVWPHTRLDSRIRVESRRFESIGLGVQSNCVAIAANAAAKVAPEQAQSILFAAAGDPFGRPGVDRNGRQVIDAVGKVGVARDEWQGTMVGKGLTVQREDSDCAGDRDPSDEFAMTTGWKSSEGNDAAMLGKVDGSCVRRAADLVLSDYQNAKDDSNAVEVMNNTAIDIDLARGRYVLDVYADGAKMPTKTIPLKGNLLSGSALVLAGNDTEKTVRDRATLVTGDLDLKQVNALVLRRGGVSEVNCDNVPMALGMIASGLGDNGEKWLDDTAKEYETAADARQIDAVGTVGKKNDAWLGAKAGSPITVARQDSACEGDANARDDFNGAPGWKVDGAVAPKASGSVEGRCMAQSRDLVLSEYQNDAEKYRSVTLFNNTGAAVDLEDAGYVLEVYGDGADSPTRTIALKGALKTGSSLTIADEDAPADVKERAAMVTRELSAPNINALVLKRVNVGGGRACMAEVVAAARDIKLPVELTQQPFAPSREPQNGDSVLGRPIGAGVASPN